MMINPAMNGSSTMLVARVAKRVSPHLVLTCNMSDVYLSLRPGPSRKLYMVSPLGMLRLGAIYIE